MCEMYFEDSYFLIFEWDMAHGETFQQAKSVNSEILTRFTLVYFTLLDLLN